MTAEEREIDRLITKTERAQKRTPGRSVYGEVRDVVKRLVKIYPALTRRFPRVVDNAVFADMLCDGKRDRLVAVLSREAKLILPPDRIIDFFQRIARLLRNDPTNVTNLEPHHVLEGVVGRPETIIPEFDLILRQHKTYRYVVEQKGLVPGVTLRYLLKEAALETEMRQLAAQRSKVERMLLHIQRALTLLPKLPRFPVSRLAISVHQAVPEQLEEIRDLLEEVIGRSSKRPPGRTPESLRADYLATMARLLPPVESRRYDKEFKELWEFAYRKQIDARSWTKARKRARGSKPQKNNIF